MSLATGTSQPASGFGTTLKTPRLTLLPFDMSNTLHMDLQLKLLHDPAFQANFGDYGVETHDDVFRLINHTRITPAICPTIAAPSPAIYLMCLEDSASAAMPEINDDPALAFPSPHGKMIGTVTLASRSSSIPPDMGWGLFCQYANQGFATEAGKEALRYWRDDCGISEIIAWPKQTNIPSLRTAAKLGFVENGFAVSTEKGERHAVYTLPGMKRFEEGTELSFFGEGEEGKPVR